MWDERRASTGAKGARPASKEHSHGAEVTKKVLEWVALDEGLERTRDDGKRS